MKNFTPLIFLVICLLFQTNNLLAQSDGCDDFKFTLKTNGVFCGSSLGSIDLEIEGGSGQYLIEWDGYGIWNDANTFFPFYTIEGLPAGDYDIKVMDVKTKCILKKTATLVSNALPEGLTVSSSPVGCDGMGMLAVKIAGQKPPFNINLKGPVTANYLANSNNFRIHNLPSGNYEIGFVVDGCIATMAATVGNADGLPQLSLSGIKGSCDISTGAVKVDITGGKAGYTLKWEGPTKGEMALDGSTEISNLVTGNYKFTLQDANGCLSMQNITIDRSGMSVALTALQAKCNQNGSIKVDITAGVAPYTVSWRGGVGEGNQGSRTVDGSSTSLSLPAGTYIIEVEDASGCSTFSSTTISVQSTDLYCSITPRSTTCGLDNGSIDVFISGGKKPYSLSYTGPKSGTVTANGSTSFADLPAGTYTTFLQDADGCSVSESSTVTVGATEDAMSAFSFSATGTSVFFFNNSTSGNYQWSFGDGSTSTSTSPSKDYSSAGAYEVCLTTTGKCNSNTQCQTIQIAALKDVSGQNLQPTDIKQDIGLRSETGNAEDLRVAQNYPNPFVNQTDIVFELPAALLTTITIHSNTGKVIQQHTAKYGKGSNLFTFNQNSLASGVYYYTIKAGTLSNTKKMLVE